MPEQTPTEKLIEALQKYQKDEDDRREKEIAERKAMSPDYQQGYDKGYADGMREAMQRIPSTPMPFPSPSVPWWQPPYGSYGSRPEQIPCRWCGRTGCTDLHVICGDGRFR